MQTTTEFNLALQKIRGFIGCSEKNQVIEVLDVPTNPNEREKIALSPMYKDYLSHLTPLDRQICQNIALEDKDYTAYMPLGYMMYLTVGESYCVYPDEKISDHVSIMFNVA